MADGNRNEVRDGSQGAPSGAPSCGDDDRDSQGKRAADLETVPEPQKPGPKPDVGPIDSQLGNEPNRSSEHRAISRAPTPARDLFTQGLLSRDLATKLGKTRGVDEGYRGHGANDNDREAPRVRRIPTPPRDSSRLQWDAWPAVDDGLLRALGLDHEPVENWPEPGRERDELGDGYPVEKREAGPDVARRQSRKVA